MYIHAITHNSTVNGPFERTVIHFQGCTLNCPGCFNTSTHPMESGLSLTVDDIIKQIPINQKHVTISGGEPFLQVKELRKLVEALYKRNIGIVLFSGFYIDEILKIPLGKDVLNMIDVLIDGRFDENIMSKNGVRGSDNQTVHIFTDRYKKEQFEDRSLEFIINSDGEFVLTGFPNSELINLLDESGLSSKK